MLPAPLDAVTHSDDSIESPTRDLTGKTRCLSIDGNHVPIKMIRVVKFSGESIEKEKKCIKPFFRDLFK